MIFRFRSSIFISLLLATLVVLPVFAGGWAVITVDELPTNITAGKAVTIGFTVLQHGRTPMKDIAPTVTAKLQFNETFVVDAKPEGKVGHYAATLTFPNVGNWEWSIQAFNMDQPLPSIFVAAQVDAIVHESVAKNQSRSAYIPLLLKFRWLAAVIGPVGIAVAIRRKSRLAVGLTVSCLVVGLGSFMTGAALAAVEAEGKPYIESSMSQVESGRQLFVVKGCITCHVNDKILNSNEYQTIETGGVDLSSFSASPEVLRLRLKDPKLVKSDTQMPNLELSAQEIEALIVFINSK